MHYAIKTLEIEIGRLEYALRVADSTTLDSSGHGHFPDRIELKRQIRELQRASEVLSQWQKDNPEEEQELRRKFGPLMKDKPS